MSSNPFAELLRRDSEDPDDTEPPEPSLNDQLEEIFSFTLNEKSTITKDLLFLEDVFKDQQSTVLTMDNIEQSIFERLFLCQKDNLTIIQNQQLGVRNPHAIEIQPIWYLYKAFVKIHNSKYLTPKCQVALVDMVLQNVTTSILQPDIYVDQDLERQMMELLKEGDQYYRVFFAGVAGKTLREEHNNDIIFTSFVDQMNRLMTVELQKSSLVNLDYKVFNYFKGFTTNAYVSEIFMDCCVPHKLHVGLEYANTPIGALFNISVLPKTPNGVYEHFTSPMDQVSYAGSSRLEGTLWSSLDKLNESINDFFYDLLRANDTIKNKALTWFGGCLKYNADRGKLWNSQAPPELNPANYITVSDGFMLNFCNLLLKLCKPFCSNIKDKKILKVDPTYPAVPNIKADSKGVHMYDLSSETCFIPMENTDGLEETRQTADKYKFITEIFFMAHKSIDIGFRVAADRMLKLNNEIARLEKAYRDAVEQSGTNSDVTNSLNDRLMSELTKFFSLRCVITEPKFAKDLFDVISATCYWLSQVALRTDFTETDNTSFAPLVEREITFPMPRKVPNTLKCIPEFIIENIVSYLVSLKRFNGRIFEEVGYEKMEPILTFILIYMGSRRYMKNPHVRARLAEGLESLLPYHKDETRPEFGGYHREMLFTQHPHRLQLIEVLMSVFVQIEMTGQNVEFEQKFNYRRPMYNIFDYLWEIPEHTDCFKMLADEAEANMDAVHAPLFLRFANLLINDAIFLLDEALANMAKLKEMQTAYNNGEWNNLSAQERAQNIGYMHHLGGIARFDNILGKETTTTLEKLTSKITNVFTHPTMVDRMASMLNYFLLCLVGPNRTNFKAKNSEEYAFDPGATVLVICKIYSNLKDSEAFCLAISQDGRSYSPNLFTWTENVLIKVGGMEILGDLKEVAEKVAKKAEEQKVNDEAILEAPEHFLDPIMSTLMVDPVILPSSRQTVDRTTIARHLLSDQTDPFNRSPLSMDQVIPNHELKEEIKQWFAGREGRVTEPMEFREILDN